MDQSQPAQPGPGPFTADVCPVPGGGSSSAPAPSLELCVFFFLMACVYKKWLWPAGGIGGAGLGRVLLWWEWEGVCVGPLPPAVTASV